MWMKLGVYFLTKIKENMRQDEKHLNLGEKNVLSGKKTFIRAKNMCTRPKKACTWANISNFTFQNVHLEVTFT